MAGESKYLAISEGVSISAPAQSFLETTSMLAYATDAAFVTAKGSAAKTGDHYFNNVSNVARIYNGTAWEDWTAGTGGGGGSQYDEVYCAESIDGFTGNPMAVSISQKQCLEIDASNSWIDINEGAGEISTQVWTVGTKPWLIYDLNFPDTTEDPYNLSDVIEDALNANVSLSGTYTVTFSEATRKFTIAATGTFAILHNTGTHTGAANIFNYLGFDTSADVSGSSSYVGANQINVSTNTAYVKRAFINKTDSSLLLKSRNFDGFITESKTKQETATVKQFTKLDTFSGLQSGSKYWTQSAAIVITNSNKFINFNPNSAGEKIATLTTGTYYRGSDSAIGYKALADHIKSVMDTADGVNTYAVVFDKNTQKFTITGSAVWIFLLKTGTQGSDNTDTHAGTILGYDDTADTASALAHTSDNIIPNASGIIGTELSSGITAESVYLGKAIKGDGTTLFTEKNFTYSDYDPISTSPNDFLATPIDQDFGTEIQLHHQHENSSGYGCRVLYDAVGGTAVYKFQYKKTNGVWTDATTTVNVGQPGAATGTENFGGNYYLRSLVFVDENNKYIAALCRFNTTSLQWQVHCYISADEGDTWTEITNVASQMSNGTLDFYVGGLYAREGKAIILGKRSDHAESSMSILDDSAGYSYTTTVALTNDFQAAQPSGCLIQYFPAETGINQYRLICLGVKSSDFDLYVQYFKGDGTSELSVKPFGTTDTVPYAFCLDQADPFNRIAVFAKDKANATSQLYQAESNEIYNAGTLTFNNHSTHDLNSGGSNIDAYNGYSTESGNRLPWNVGKRAILANDFCAVIAGTAANPAGGIAAMLFHTKAVTTGIWETVQNIGDSASGDNCQEWNIQFVKSSPGCLISWKYNSNTLANNLTNGIIKTRFFEILTGNVISFLTTETIDGGESMTGFQGFLTSSASNNSVSLSWEKFDGATRDTLITNQFN